MKFCDISSFYSDKGGGVRTYHHQKARYFESSSEHEYVMIVPSSSYRFERWGRTRIYRIKGFPVSSNGVYRQLLDLVTLRAILHNEQPDVVEVGSCYLDNWLALIGTLNRRPLLSGFYHADFPDSYMAPAVEGLPRPLARGFVRFWQKYVRFSYSRLDLTLVASRYIQDKLRTYGLDNTRLTPLGVDTRLFNPEKRCEETRLAFGLSEGARLILHVGRFSPEKGVDALVDSLPALLAGNRDHVVLVGDGPLREKVVTAAGGHERVHVLDFISDPEDLARLMASSDLFISPGPYETFGLSTLEAMSSGLPVVAAATGGAAQLVSNGSAGLLFEPGSGESLAGAARLLLDNDLLDEAGTRGRRFTEENLSWERAFDRMVRIYREAGESILGANAHWRMAS